MTSVNGPSRASRQNVAVVLMAVAVLAAVGAGFRYVLGTASKPVATKGPNRLGVTRTATKQVTPTARAGKTCPSITERAARDAGSPGDLRQRLYIKTDESEVWICEDKGGKLWYQGHRLSGP